MHSATAASENIQSLHLVVLECQTSSGNIAAAEANQFAKGPAIFEFHNQIFNASTAFAHYSKAISYNLLLFCADILSHRHKHVDMHSII